MCFSIVLCIGIRAHTNDSWTSKLSEIWDACTLQDKHDIKRQHIEFHWHFFYRETWNRGGSYLTTSIQRKDGTKSLLGTMSMFNDIEWHKRGNEDVYIRNAKHPIFVSTEPLVRGEMKVVKGKQTFFFKPLLTTRCSSVAQFWHAASYAFCRSVY